MICLFVFNYDYFKFIVVFSFLPLKQQKQYFSKNSGIIRIPDPYTTNKSEMDSAKLIILQYLMISMKTSDTLAMPIIAATGPAGPRLKAC